MRAKEIKSNNYNCGMICEVNNIKCVLKENCKGKWQGLIPHVMMNMRNFQKYINRFIEDTEPGNNKMSKILENIGKIKVNLEYIKNNQKEVDRIIELLNEITDNVEV